MTQKNEKLSADEKIRLLIKEKLINEDLKGSYLNILEQRIQENRKSIAQLFIGLVLTALAFPLITEAKISEISVGPFKIIDNQIALGIIPTIFTFIFYKYLMIWLDLTQQKMIFRNLTAETFNVKVDSYINNRIKPFSIIDSVTKYHQRKKLDTIGCFSHLLWIPAGFIIMISPLVYEFYLIKKLFDLFQRETILHWIIFLLPIFIGLFTILMLVEAFTKDFEET